MREIQTAENKTLKLTNVVSRRPATLNSPQEQRRQAAALSLQGRTTGRAPAASMRHWLPCSLA